MALIPCVFSRAVTEEGLDEIIATWTGAGDTDTLAPVSLPQRADRTIQAFGTFGGATISMMGSNDGTHYAFLNDAFGNQIGITAAANGLKQITESSLWVQPATANGSGSSLTVIMTFRRVLR
jgi:hypothetical protein